MTAPLLMTRDLRHAFGKVEVLRGLDLQVDEGRHCAIMGPSGSGKSTLLHLLARLLEPTAGTIEFRGEPLATAGPAAAFRLRHLGIVFQDVHLLESLSVRQNVDLIRCAAGPRAQRLPLEALIPPLGLEPLLDTPARVLSRGERQRVGMARAFANAPEVVLADEPTASLDPSLRERTLDHLFDLCDRVGATAIVVTHDEAVARRRELAAIHRLEQGALRTGPRATGSVA